MFSSYHYKKNKSIPNVLNTLFAFILLLLFQAVVLVSNQISAVAGGSSSSGTEMTAAAFIILVTQFINLIQTNFIAVSITSMALSIVTAKVSNIPWFLISNEIFASGYNSI